MLTEDRRREVLNYILGFDRDRSSEDGLIRYVVRARFNEAWQLYNNDSGEIRAVRDDRDRELCYFFGEVTKVELDDIYELISETISINTEAEKKFQLLHDKVNELKVVFQEHTLDELRSLKFVLGSEQVTVKNPLDASDKLPKISEAKAVNPLSSVTAKTVVSKEEKKKQKLVPVVDNTPKPETQSDNVFKRAKASKTSSLKNANQKAIPSNGLLTIEEVEKLEEQF